MQFKRGGARLKVKFGWAISFSMCGIFSAAGSFSSPGVRSIARWVAAIKLAATKQTAQFPDRLETGARLSDDECEFAEQQLRPGFTDDSEQSGTIPRVWAGTMMVVQLNQNSARMILNPRIATGGL